MKELFMDWGDNVPSFEIVGNGLLIGLLAGIGEAAIVRFILDIFGVFERAPIFG